MMFNITGIYRHIVIKGMFTALFAAESVCMLLSFTDSKNKSLTD